MDPANLEAFLQHCPNAVNVKNSSGELAIHRAVQQGNINNVQVLLKYEADLDAVSSTGQTPLMFASYYAHLNIMHLLVQKGVNIAAVDNSGCDAVHYAVNGGQVSAIHYLTQVCGLSTHSRDLRLQTPLFKACGQGHVDMLKYLLRKDRSDVKAVDVAGNSPLHIAAEKCHSWTCWRLLEEGGLELLHKINKDTQIPLDVAVKCSPFKNSPAVKMLRYYSSLGVHSGQVIGPRFSWWCHLLKPFVGYLAIFMIIHFTGHRGLVTVVLLACLLKSILCHQPRMRLYCRWPDPVYVGMFAAGFVNTTICLFHELLIHIYTKLPVVTVIVMCIHIVTMIVYLKLLTSHPESCSSSSVDENTGNVHSIVNIADGNISVKSFCPQCEIIIPRYVHHCNLCDVCVHDMDHHCLLMNKCIGRGNHRLFVLFLVMCIANMACFVTLSMWFFHNEFSIFIVDMYDIVQAIFNYYIFLWTMLLGNASSLGWCIGMLMTQLWMISNGYLIAFGTGRGTNLTYRKRINNLVAFVMGNHIQRDGHQTCFANPDVSLA